MMAKLLLALACVICFSGGVQPRTIDTIRMFELQPAIPIENHLKNVDVGDVIYKNCSKSSDKFEVSDVKIAGCTKSPCILKKGTSAQVEIDFIAHEVTSNVTAKVYGQIAGVNVPFPLSNPDACTCGVTCPTKSGTKYSYKYSLPVLEAYPSITCVVLWYFEDAQGVEELCIDVLVQIE